MNESKTEKKNIQEQTLEMARSALGRMKEMDLTPEQKEELINKIEQAQVAEKAGNIAGAITIYKELKDLITGWQNPETLADKQIKRIEELIARETLSDRDNAIKNKAINALEKQIEIIKLDDEEKTKTAKAFRIDAKIVPEEDEVLPVFFGVVGKEVPQEDLFLIEKYFNKKGKLLKLKFGVVGTPNCHYEYMLKGYANGEPHHSDSTSIYRKVETRKNFFESKKLAEFSNKGEWKEV